MSASPTNDRKIPHQDTRPPKLADVPAFIEDIGRGWQERVISAPVLDGAAAAAATHRDRLRAALPGRTVIVAAGRARSGSTTRRGGSVRTVTFSGLRVQASRTHSCWWDRIRQRTRCWTRALGIAVRPVQELDEALGRVGTVLAGRRVPAEIRAERSEELDRVCSDVRRIKDDGPARTPGHRSQAGG